MIDLAKLFKIRKRESEIIRKMLEIVWKTLENARKMLSNRLRGELVAKKCSKKQRLIRANDRRGNREAAWWEYSGSFSMRASHLEHPKVRTSKLEANGLSTRKWRARSASANFGLIRRIRSPKECWTSVLNFLPKKFSKLKNFKTIDLYIFELLPTNCAPSSLSADCWWVGLSDWAVRLVKLERHPL